MRRAPLLLTLTIASTIVAIIPASPSRAQSHHAAPRAITPARATAACPARPPADTASIEGSLYFPNTAVNPAMTIVAIRQSPADGCAYYVSTTRGMDRDRLEALPAGDYLLVAYATDGAGRARAGSYTDSVTCMAACGHRGDCCRDAHHVPHVIHLGTQRLRHISIADWDATLPPRPAQIP